MEKERKEVRAFLSVPPFDYKIDWNAKKEWFPRIEEANFLEPGNSEDDKLIAQAKLDNVFHLSWVNKSIEVLDSDGGPLPETIYFIVFCSGYYRGVFGGSSWYVERAYLTEENARNGLPADSKWERWWVMEARRKR